MPNLDPINNTKYENVNKAPKISVSSPLPPKQVSLLTTTSKGSKKKKIFKITLLVILLAILSFGTLLTIRAVDLSNKIFVGKKTTFFGTLKSIFTGGAKTILIGEDLGQVNVLLLGIGGEGHEGPYLSDTLILAQIRPDINEVSLTSIPRDYLADIPKVGQTKINRAFAEGFNQNQDWDEAGRWAREAVEKISGLKIPYFAVVDFKGFEKAVDQIGGLGIEIERTFTDYQFPDNNFGYLAPITFTQGSEHMNGKRALQFARSRHAAGFEGSDFARSQRQQKVLNSFKSKILDLNIFSDAGKINNLLGIFADHFHTNITPGQISRLYSFAKNDSSEGVKLLSTSLDPETKIICPFILPESGAYVLVPCQGKTEQDVKNFFKNSFSIGKLVAEKPVVWLATSTGDKVAFQEAFKKLQEVGFVVWEVGFTKDNFPQTIVYSVNEKPSSLEFIKNTLEAETVTLPPPGLKIDSTKVDLVVILGKNS